MVIVLFNILFIACYLFSFIGDVSVFGYSYTSDFITRISYMFAHRSFIHFALSMFAFNYMAHQLKKTNRTYLIWVAMLIAFISTFGSEEMMVTIGSSGLLYALVGFPYAMAIIRKSLNLNNGIILAIIILSNIAYYLLGKPINVLLHLYSFLYAFLFTLIIELWQRTKNKKSISQN